MVIEHADFEGIERISAAVGAEILSTFNNPERASKILGRCDLIEEIMIGEDKMIKFSGCAAGNYLYVPVCKKCLCIDNMSRFFSLSLSITL